MSTQDDLYRNAVKEHGAALERLARAYEAGPEDRRDLLQEIHIALWRSFTGFDERCSLRTWAFRVAHNTAVTHIYRSRRTKRLDLLSIEELEESEQPAVSSSSAAVVELHLYRSRVQCLHASGTPKPWGDLLLAGHFAQFLRFDLISFRGLKC